MHYTIAAFYLCVELDLQLQLKKGCLPEVKPFVTLSITPLLSILKVKGETVDFIEAFNSSEGLSNNLGSSIEGGWLTWKLTKEADRLLLMSPCWTGDWVPERGVMVPYSGLSMTGRAGVDSSIVGNDFWEALSSPRSSRTVLRVLSVWLGKKLWKKLTRLYSYLEMIICLESLVARIGTFPSLNGLRSDGAFLRAESLVLRLGRRSLAAARREFGICVA